MAIAYIAECNNTGLTYRSSEQAQLSLLMIDVDYFKAYNDAFGHLEGDDALRQVAKAIRANSSRPSDLPARYGGEESALVLPNTLPGGARLQAEKLRQSIASMNIPHIAPSQGSSLTVSIGLATVVSQVFLAMAASFNRAPSQFHNIVVSTPSCHL
jgi:two-component system chemotaxis family response regulator WspR